MKRSLTAGIIALTLAFVPSAFAKDIASIDLLSGDYVGVAGVEFDQLATRPLYKKVITDQLVESEYAKAKSTFDKWTDGKLDSEKDVDLAIFGVPADYSKSEHIAIIEFKKDVKEAVASFDAKIASNDKYEKREVDKNVFYIEKRNNEWMYVVDDKRVAVGSEREVKAVAATMKAGKAAKPVSANKSLYKEYGAADKKADVWGAFVLTSKEKAELKSVVLDGADGKSFKGENINSGTFSVKLDKGFELLLNARMKNDAAAADGASVITTTLDGFLGDPALTDMGLGFLKNGIKVTAAKSILTGSIKFSPSEVDTLIGLGREAGASMLQQGAPAAGAK
ncbi:MAG: hypothetical protein II767_04255 [Proteobacteria bacterium]|nr:hypothetical protein [Pseudomonadota bacterium]